MTLIANDVGILILLGGFALFFFGAFLADRKYPKK